jgi:hypothetical protein
MDSNVQIVITIIVILILAYYFAMSGSTSAVPASHMYNGFDFYNPAFAPGIVPTGLPPGIQPPEKTYTQGGLPNPYMMLDPAGRFLGKYDYLQQNVDGRNAFPADFDFSSYHDRDCGCGCNGRLAAQKDATDTAKNLPDPSAVTPLPGSQTKQNSHMVSSTGRGPKYANVLASTIGTVNAGNWPIAPCEKGVPSWNPQSCSQMSGSVMPAVAGMGYNMGDAVAQTTGNTQSHFTSHYAHSPSQRNLGATSATVSGIKNFDAETAGYTPYGQRNALDWANQSSINPLIKLNLQEDLQASSVARADKFSGVNSGKINPHIDSGVVTGVSPQTQKYKSKMRGNYRDVNIYDETKEKYRR